MILVVAEKHNIGKAIATAILSTDKMEKSKFHISGTLEEDSRTKICIAWFNGHIAELKTPNQYHSPWKSWNIDLLPLSPPGMDFQYNVTNQPLFDNLCRLIGNEPEEIVNACDAGREGELIFREALDLLGEQSAIPGRITRMWIDSTTTTGLAIVRIRLNTTI